MKNSLIIFLIFLYKFSAFAQNQAPDILKYGTELNSGDNFVKIVYDLVDNENDDIKISLKISNNGGKTYTFPVGVANGDIGFPVKPGTGKTILWYFPDTVSFNSLISGRFILKLVADDLHDYDIQQIVDQVDMNSLYQNLSFIQGIRHRTEGVQHLQEVKDLIENKFLQYGLNLEKDEFSYTNDDGSKYLGQNIIGKLCGNYDETVYYIIDGHYDSVGWGPGADDNGSAVAGVLEAARILSIIPFEKNIRFIGFDMEETRITGSRNYVSKAIPANEQLAGVLNFEMIGYYKDIPNTQEIPDGFNILFPTFYQQVAANNFKGDFAFNVANVASNDLKIVFDNCAAQFVPQLKVYSLATPGVGESTLDLRRSDHSSFWDGGYKALMINDGANFRNKNYHTATDVIDSLNFTFMSNIVKATIATLCKLAVPIHGIARPFPISEYSVNAPLISNNAKSKLVRVIPNPVSGNATIYYKVPKAGIVKLEIYNSNGILIKELVNTKLDAGEYESSIYNDVLNTGIYLYKYSIDKSVTESGKIVFMNK